MTSVALLLVLALVAGVVAWQQNRTSDRRQLEAAAGRAATAADTLRFSDPVLALRLAVAAWRLNPVPETRSALLGALGQNEHPPFAPDLAGLVDGFALSPDGRTLLSLDGPDGITRWDLDTRRRTSGHRSPPGGGFPPTASPDGRHLIVEDDDGERLRLWDVHEERFLGPWVPSSARGEAEEAVTLPDQPAPDSGEPGAGFAVTATVAAHGFSSSGRAWTSQTGDRLRVRDIEGRRLYDGTLPGGDTTAYDIAPDNRTLAMCTPKGLRLWDRSSDPLFRQELKDHIPEQLAIDLRAGVFRYVARGTRDTGVVRTVGISRVVRPSWHRHAADEAVLSADGSTLAVLRDRGDETGHVALYDTRTGRPRSEIPAVPAARPDDPWSTPGLALSADGRRLAVSRGPSEDGTGPAHVTVWDTVRERRLSTVRPPADSYSDFTLSPDGRELTTTDGMSPTLTAWNAADGRRLRRVTGPRKPDDSGGMSSVSAISADGRMLLHDDGTLVPTAGPPAPKARLDAHAVAAFSPDGDTVALLDLNGRITLWDVRRGTSLGILSGGTSLNGPSDDPESTTALAFSPDGSVLVAVGATGTLRMWDVPTRRPLGTDLATAGDDITSLVFSPDGGTVFAAGHHVPLQRYTVDPDRVAEAACRRAEGGLTRSQWRAYLPDVPYRRVCGQE